jgi:hypothetical protein
MAKKNNAVATDTTENAPTTTETRTAVGLATPEGFEDVSTDIEALYDYRHTPEMFIRPVHFTLSDSKDKKKPSVLIHADLLKPAMLFAADEDGEELREFPAGTRVGIWYRPGLRGIMQCGGAVTYLALAGEKDVGQIQAMKVFKVSKRKGETGAQLNCASDYRKMTRNMPLPWESAEDAKARSSARGGTQSAPNDDDEVPF